MDHYPDSHRPTGQNHLKKKITDNIMRLFSSSSYSYYLLWSHLVFGPVVISSPKNSPLWGCAFESRELQNIRVCEFRLEFLSYLKKNTISCEKKKSLIILCVFFLLLLILPISCEKKSMSLCQVNSLKSLNTNCCK